MPRIRSLKPEFFSSLTITSLPIPARLTFAGLWCYVDDEGRGVYDLDLLKAFIWPKDRDVTGEVIAEHLGCMEGAGLLVRYASPTCRGLLPLLQIVNFREHQHPEKPKKSKHPAPHEVPTPPLLVGDASPTDPRLVVGGKVGEGRGEEGKVEEEKTLSPDGDGATPATLVLTPESEPRRPSGKPTWLTPYGETWERIMGGPPAYGILAKALKPVHETMGPERLNAALGFYLQDLVDTNGVRFVNLSRFASMAGQYEHGAPYAGADDGLRDEPEIMYADQLRGTKP